MQCPHCLKHFHLGKWEKGPLIHDREAVWGVIYTVCPACGRAILMFGHMSTGQGPVLFDDAALRLVHPKAISRSPIPKEVPEEFAADYREACLVLPDSEKASAALSRRCLQHLLREKAGIKKGDLANEIQQVLDSKQLPGYLAEALDAIRNIGNFAAHAMKSTHTGMILDVEPQEAEWLLNLLEGLLDFYFVHPARAQAKKDALNAKLQSVGKPPMKQP